MLSWLFSPRSCADPQDGAASPAAAATPPPATPSGTTAGPAAWAVQATPSSSVQHRLTVTAQAAGPAVQRYNTRPTTRSTSDVGSRTKAQPKLERSANGLLCFRAGLQCIPHCTHPYCGPRGLHRCTKASGKLDGKRGERCDTDPAAQPRRMTKAWAKAFAKARRRPLSQRYAPDS